MSLLLIRQPIGGGGRSLPSHLSPALFICHFIRINAVDSVSTFVPWRTWIVNRLLVEHVFLDKAVLLHSTSANMDISTKHFQRRRKEESLQFYKLVYSNNQVWSTCKCFKMFIEVYRKFYLMKKGLKTKATVL